MSIRKSVRTVGVSRWWETGWMYVMPDFDNRDHSIIEWPHDQVPVYPNFNPANEASDVERAE